MSESNFTGRQLWPEGTLWTKVLNSNEARYWGFHDEGPTIRFRGTDPPRLQYPAPNKSKKMWRWLGKTGKEKNKEVDVKPGYGRK